MRWISQRSVDYFRSMNLLSVQRKPRQMELRYFLDHFQLHAAGCQHVLRHATIFCWNAMHISFCQQPCVVGGTGKERSLRDGGYHRGTKYSRNKHHRELSVLEWWKQWTSNRRSGFLSSSTAIFWMTTYLSLFEGRLTWGDSTREQKRCQPSLD